MKKYLYDYIYEIDNLLKHKDISDFFIKQHLVKIGFFQHERFIHLLVTMFFGMLFLFFLVLGFFHYLFFIIAMMLLIFLIFYVVHYFRLENGVQYLYLQYDKLNSKRK